MNRVEIIREYAKKKRENVWSPFLNLLNRPDGFIQNMTSRIIAKLACWSRDPMEGSDLTFYLTWLKDQLQTPGNEYVQTTARCLQMMLRDEKYRLVFAGMGGVSVLANILSGRINFQVKHSERLRHFKLMINDLFFLVNRFNINYLSVFG
jgi:V-type H+-transporting ATPase subunit H